MGPVLKKGFSGAQGIDFGENWGQILSTEAESQLTGILGVESKFLWQRNLRIPPQIGLRDRSG